MRPPAAPQPPSVAPAREVARADVPRRLRFAALTSYGARSRLWPSRGSDDPSPGSARGGTVHRRRSPVDSAHVRTVEVEVRRSTSDVHGHVHATSTQRPRASGGHGEGRKLDPRYRATTLHPGFMGGGGGVAKVPYYRGVRGSAALATRPLHAPAPAPEALEPGEMRRVPFAGELVGAVRVRAGFAAIPLDVFDRACGRPRGGGAGGVPAPAAALGRRGAQLVPPREAGAHGPAAPLRAPAAPRPRRARREALRAPAAPRQPRHALARLPAARGRRRGARRRRARGPSGGAAGRPRRRRPPRRRGAAPAPPRPARPRAAGRARPRVAAPKRRSLARSRPRAAGPDAEGVAGALREVRDLLAEGQPPERIAAGIETVRRRAARAAHAGESP